MWRCGSDHVGGRRVGARVVSSVFVDNPLGLDARPTCVCVAESGGLLRFRKPCICGFRYGIRQHKVSSCLRERQAAVDLYHTIRYNT